jgi:hypothetical protein
MISLHDICCCCVFLRCPFGVLGLHTASRFLVLVLLDWLSFGFVEYHPQLIEDVSIRGKSSGRGKWRMAVASSLTVKIEVES